MCIYVERLCRVTQAQSIPWNVCRSVDVTWTVSHFKCKTMQMHKTNSVDTVRTWLLLLTYPQLHIPTHTKRCNKYTYILKCLLFIACLLPEGAVSKLNIHPAAKDAFKACVSYVCVYEGALGTYRHIGYSLVLLIQQLKLADWTQLQSHT